MQVESSLVFLFGSITGGWAFHNQAGVAMGPAPLNPTYSTFNGFHVSTYWGSPKFVWTSKDTSSWFNASASTYDPALGPWGTPSVNYNEGYAVVNSEIDVIERGALSLAKCDNACANEAIAQFQSSFFENNTKGFGYSGSSTTDTFDFWDMLSGSVHTASKAEPLGALPSCLMGCSCDAYLPETFPTLPGMDAATTSCAAWCDEDAPTRQHVVQTNGWSLTDQLSSDGNSLSLKYGSMMQQYKWYTNDFLEYPNASGWVSTRYYRREIARGIGFSMGPIPLLNESFFPYNAAVCIAACEARGVCGVNLNSGQALTMSVAVVAVLMSQWL